MNDILAVVMVCLASELTAQTGDIFTQLHSPASFWSEAYWLHARIMALGAERIYYRDLPSSFDEREDTQRLTVSTQASSCRGTVSARGYSLASSGFEDLKARRKETKRERLRKSIRQQTEDAQRTDLKMRALRIFNGQLKAIDPELHRHLVTQKL